MGLSIQDCLPRFRGRFGFPAVKMQKQNFEIIEQLRYYLTLQLEAHQQQDWQHYNELEKVIRQLEQQL